MTISTQPIDPRVRNAAQGPHDLGQAGGSGYFLNLRDLPNSVVAEYKPNKLSLTFQYEVNGYEESADNEDVGSGGLWSPPRNQLEMSARFLKSRRRILSVEFDGFDPAKVSAKELVSAVSRLGATVSLAGPDQHMTPYQALTIKALGAMLKHLLPVIRENLVAELGRKRKR